MKNFIILFDEKKLKYAIVRLLDNFLVKYLYFIIVADQGGNHLTDIVVEKLTQMIYLIA